MKLKLRIQNLSKTMAMANETLKKVTVELEASMTKGISHLNSVAVQGHDQENEQITLEDMQLPNLQHFMY
jgi:hypothetical protein